MDPEADFHKQHQTEEDQLVVVDNNGNPTGKTVGYFKAHQDGDWHQSAHVWIYNSKGEVLLQRRGKHAVFPDMYDISAAGHVTDGTTPLETAITETEEELGFTPRDEELIKVAVKRVEEKDEDRDWVNNEYAHIFIIKCEDLSRLKINKKEVAEVRWIDNDQLSFEIDDDLGSQKYVPHGEYYHFIMALVRERIHLDGS